MENDKTWFCQECRVLMEPQAGMFDKCPECGAEAWPSGEASYKQNKQGAELAIKKHGVWYCQRCRVPMIAIEDTYCKCPQCATEVWYGKKTHAETRNDIRAVMETTEDFPVFNHSQDIYAAIIGGRPTKGGGSRSGKPRHKTDLSKPTTKELYRRLCDG